MNANLRWFNLVGVLALAVLCVVQWHHDRQLNLECSRSEKTRMALGAKLAEEVDALAGMKEDLAQLKTSLAAKQAALAQSELELRRSSQTNQLLMAERAQLKSAITNWAGTVIVQKARIKEANSRIEQLATELNASVVKFNGLATNYDTTVGELNALRATNSAGTSPRPNP